MARARHDLTPYDQPEYEPVESDDDQGDQGDDTDQDVDDDDDQADDVTPAAPADPAPAAAKGRPATGAVERGSGVVLGVVLYAISMQFLRGGPSQVKQWLSAKLTNSGAGTGSPDAHTLQPKVVPPGFGGPGNQLNVEPPPTGPTKKFPG